MQAFRGRCCQSEGGVERGIDGREAARVALSETGPDRGFGCLDDADGDELVDLVEELRIATDEDCDAEIELFEDDDPGKVARKPA